ncbi:SirB2 family protein [Vibrio tritonius]|uniref:SirB2 family protein n=1 Tax=Vibrio tritonius TaxID=1435069 RepID=A0ABS7YGU7_9VIBR|nr:SirB2 family protein [Vibrio tritonius]MCA2014896.1 SirB2 family protein [Vibrio tritonius]
MYVFLKNLHLLTIGISVFLLSIRYVLMMMDSPKLQNKFLKIFPHVNDTALLLTGIALIYITGFVPWSPAVPWMMSKLTCVIAYIALGFFALKIGRNKMLRTFAFFGALGWLAMAGKIAVTKLPMFFS